MVTESTVDGDNDNDSDSDSNCRRSMDDILALVDQASRICLFDDGGGTVNINCMESKDNHSSSTDIIKTLSHEDEEHRHPPPPPSALQLPPYQDSAAFRTPPTVMKRYLPSSLTSQMTLITPPPLQLPASFKHHHQKEQQRMKHTSSTEEEEELHDDDEKAGTDATVENRCPLAWPQLHSSLRKRTYCRNNNTSAIRGNRVALADSAAKNASPAVALRCDPPVVPLLPSSPELEFNSSDIVGRAVGRTTKEPVRRRGTEADENYAAQAPSPVEATRKRDNPFMNHLSILPIHSPIGGYSLTRPSNLDFVKKFKRQQDAGAGTNDNNNVKSTNWNANSTPSPSDRALKRAMLLSHSRRLSSYSSSIAIPILEDGDMEDIVSAGSLLPPQPQQQEDQQSTWTPLPHRSLHLPPPPSQYDAPVTFQQHPFNSFSGTSLVPKVSVATFATSKTDALSPPAPLSRLRRRDGMEHGLYHPSYTLL